VAGAGHHQGEAGLHQGEDLVVEEGGLHLLEDDLLLEGDLHRQGEEADLEEDPDHQLDAQEDLLPGLLEAGLAVQQDAEGTRHQAALIHRVKNYQKLFPVPFVLLFVILHRVVRVVFKSTKYWA